MDECWDVFSLNRFTPSQNCTSWDALSNLLWQSLTDSNERRVAIVWISADDSIRQNLQIVFNAIEVFVELGKTLSSPTTNDLNPIVLRLIMVNE